MNEDIPFFYQDCISLMFKEFDKYDSLNFIDVGAYNGGWINIFKSLAKGKQFFSIAIDPVRQTLEENPGLKNEPLLNEYDVFLEAAISTENGLRQFYRYTQSEQNGSLRKMKRDGITYDRKEKDKFFINQKAFSEIDNQYFSIEDISEIKEMKTVQCYTLEHVHNKFITDNGLIHFLKIDTQGTDIETFLSLGDSKIRNNCLFVQLECTMSKFKTAQMYEGGSIFLDDVKVMEKFGYDIVNIRNYHKYVSEADVVFVNRKLIS